MKIVSYGTRKYRVDAGGFLLDRDEWDEDFVEGLAPKLNIPRLTGDHWKVIHYIRNTCRREGRCPLVYETCRANHMRLKELQNLFPTGYQRGACKLAGITYKDAYPEFLLVPSGRSGRPVDEATDETVGFWDKTYEVDVYGFLVDPNDWDQRYAFIKALEMGYARGLTEQHWKIINFLRESFKKQGTVPTVYETCEANNLELEDLERLFPHGYHRGAVKLAGLRVP